MIIPIFDFYNCCELRSEKMAVHGTFLLISLLLAISYSFEAPSSLFGKNALPDITALEELRSQAESVLEGQAVELIGQSKSESERIRPQGDWLEVLFKQFCLVFKRPYIDDVQEYNLRKSFFLVNYFSFTNSLFPNGRGQWCS